MSDLEQIAGAHPATLPQRLDWLARVTALTGFVKDREKQVRAQVEDDLAGMGMDSVKVDGHTASMVERAGPVTVVDYQALADWLGGLPSAWEVNTPRLLDVLDGDPLFAEKLLDLGVVEMSPVWPSDRDDRVRDAAVGGVLVDGDGTVLARVGAGSSYLRVTPAKRVREQTRQLLEERVA